MIKPKNNEELKKMIVHGVINCKGKDLICDFSIDVDADIINVWDITALNITAWNIEAWNINASDIIANNINARNIYALNIIYYAVCCAYYDIKCSSIFGRRDNHKHFCLDGKITIKKWIN